MNRLTVCAIGMAALLGISTAPPNRQAAPIGSAASKIGVELDGIGDGGRAKPFIDLAKTLRPWTLPDGKPAPTDEHGWPTVDAQTVLFDIRPVAAWQGPDHIDDAQKFQPDWSGTYHVSFKGQAQIRILQN